MPKQRKTFCKGKNCKKHTLHKVTQYKKGRDSIHVQGNAFSINSALSLLKNHFIVNFVMMKTEFIVCSKLFYDAFSLC